MRSPRFTSLGRTAVAATALALAATACSSSTDPAASGDPGRSDPGGALFAGFRGAAPVNLLADRDCDAVLEDLQARAPEVLVDQFFGFGGAIAVEEGMAMDDAGGADGDFATSAGAAAPTPATTESAVLSATGNERSDTNTQEAGIDEPDVVENDGAFVYVVHETRLVILDGATAEVVSTTDLGTYGAQLLLQDDRLLVIAGGGHVASEPELVDPPPGVDGVVHDLTPPPGFFVGTSIALYDVSDRTAPSLVERTEVEGNHVSTRVVNGVARTVVTSYPDFHSFVEGPAMEAASVAIQQAFAGGDDDMEAAFGMAAAAVTSSVQETEIEDWLPAFRTTTADATSIEGQLVACEDVLVPELNAGMAETSILRFDFDGGFDPTETTTIVGDAGTIYASNSTLYLAANQYTPVRVQDQGIDGYATAIHAFDLTGDGAAPLAGSGAVPGHVLNQYSLSEFEGHLRIATTEGSPWSPGPPSSSGVRVLRLEPVADGAPGVLTQVGSVTGLGVTEVIQSVRFLGEVGYVVTFRQTDPLYVIDLSDPEDPATLGELKIPGFSSYLHPAGPGRLIGIGRDADLDGRDQGLLVSLFDVSDPTDPRQIQTYTERDAYSSAGFDPKAFLYWAPESAIAIPVERYGIRNPEPPPAQPVEPEPRPVEPQDDRDGITFEEPDPDRAQGDEPPKDEPLIVQSEPFFEPDFDLGIVVLDVSDSAITERGTVRVGGRSPSRALVVNGRLWSLFDGGVAVSGFGNVADATYHPYTG